MLGVFGYLSFLLATVLLFVFWINVPKALWNFHRRCKYLRNFPSWPAHWLWGHLHLIKADEPTMMRFTKFVCEKKPKIAVFWFGPFFASVGVPHPQFLKTLLKEEKSRPVYKMLVPWLGEGLLIAEGRKWARSRRLLTPAFHFEILKGYIPVYNDCLKSLLGKWKRSVQQGTPVKLFDTISLLSLDIILQCAFSHKSNCQNERLEHHYVKAVYDLSHLCTDRFLNPLYHIDWIYALTTSGQRMRQACRTVHNHSLKVINERRKALNLHQSSATNQRTFDLDSLYTKVSETRKYLDFLDILLTATDDTGTGMSDEDIRAEVDTFMFEGHDTTTSGKCWTLYCLAKHPEHQEKVREEVRSVLMGRECLEYDDLKELKYTQWCIKEAMRLYPPVPEVYRQVSKDVTLENYTIPKGTIFSVMIYLIHHNPEVWEDPEQFDPLRFHPSNVEKRDPYAYIPFSAGHRNCIGQNFAMNEEKVVIATIVSRFRLTLDEGHTIEMAPRLILRTKYDIQVFLEELDV